MQYFEIRVKHRKERILISIVLNKKITRKDEEYFIFWDESIEIISTRCGSLKGVTYSCSCGFLGEAISSVLDGYWIFICPECNLHITKGAFGNRVYDYKHPTTKEKLALLMAEIIK